MRVKQFRPPYVEGALAWGMLTEIKGCNLECKQKNYEILAPVSFARLKQVQKNTVVFFPPAALFLLVYMAFNKIRGKEAGYFFQH